MQGEPYEIRKFGITSKHFAFSSLYRRFMLRTRFRMQVGGGKRKEERKSKGNVF